MAEETEQAVVVDAEAPPQITVEVAPDTEKPGKPQLSDEEVAQMDTLPPDDEIGRYAKDAQKRIKSLHVANQEWRRRVAQSQKDVATATSLAEQLYRENQTLKSSVNKSETALIEQALQRTEAQLTSARQRAMNAYAAQNHAEIVAANEDVARYVAEADRLRLLKPAPQDSDPAPGAPAAVSPSSASASPQAAPAQPSPATQAWVSKNPWFNKQGEERMTSYAMGVHASLAAQGITEANGAAYWGAIDKELREKFPERFNGDAAPKEASRPVTVTGATRTPAPRSGPRHVVLTESEVRIAHNLGLTNEQYAAQKIKEEAAAGKEMRIQ
jgi:hypothetical protein